MARRETVRPEKVQSVAAIAELAGRSSSIILTDYRGMSVKQMTDLRRALLHCGAQYKVIRNTFAALALADQDKVKEKLTGSIAILFSGGDVIPPTKQLVEFIKEHEKPAILGGLLDNQFLTKEAVIQLSKLPGRPELLAKVLRCFNGPIGGFTNVLAGTLRKLIYALNAVKDKKSQEKAPIEPGQGGEK